MLLAIFYSHHLFLLIRFNDTFRSLVIYLTEIKVIHDKTGAVDLILVYGFIFKGANYA